MTIWARYLEVRGERKKTKSQISRITDWVQMIEKRNEIGKHITKRRTWYRYITYHIADMSVYETGGKR